MGRGTPARGRGPACGGGLREACGMPAGGRCPVWAAYGGRPAERLRGLRPRVWRRAAGDLRNPRGGRCPAWAAGGVGRGTPARAEAPRAAGGLRNARERPMPRAWRRPAGGLRNARGGGRGPACTAARMGRGTPARTDAPRVRRAAGDLRNPRGRPMPRVYGGLRSACRTPAGDRCPRRTTQGGTHSASPQTVEQSFARGLPARGSAGPSARRGRPPANPAACAVYQAS